MSDYYPLHIFIAFAKEDRKVRDNLLRQMNLVKISQQWEIWSSKEINASERWEEQIQERLMTADVIILLLSVDFFNSKYIIEHELPNVIKRHSRGDCQIIPVIVRSCHWEDTEFGKYAKLGDIQALPSGAKPILPKEKWANDEDQPYYEVVDGLKKATTMFRKKKSQKPAATKTISGEAIVKKIDIPAPSSNSKVLEGLPPKVEQPAYIPWTPFILGLMLVVGGLWYALKPEKPGSNVVNAPPQPYIIDNSSLYRKINTDKAYLQRSDCALDTLKSWEAFYKSKPAGLDSALSGTFDKNKHKVDSMVARLDSIQTQLLAIDEFIAKGNFFDKLDKIGATRHYQDYLKSLNKPVQFEKQIADATERLRIIGLIESDFSIFSNRKKKPSPAAKALIRLKTYAESYPWLNEQRKTYLQTHAR